MVGEIGVPRREFLFEIQFWEVQRIVRGYRRRGRLRDQLIAEATYAALFSMRDPKGKTVKDLFPDIFEDDDYDRSDGSDTITDEDVDFLQAEMAAMNGMAAEPSEPTEHEPNEHEPATEKPPTNS